MSHRDLKRQEVGKKGCAEARKYLKQLETVYWIELRRFGKEIARVDRMGAVMVGLELEGWKVKKVIQGMQLKPEVIILKGYAELRG